MGKGDGDGRWYPEFSKGIFKLSLLSSVRQGSKLLKNLTCGDVFQGLSVLNYDVFIHILNSVSQETLELFISVLCPQIPP